MRRHVVAISFAAAVLAGCGPLADLSSGEEDAQEETVQEGVSPTGEAAEPEAAAEEEGDTPADDGAWDHAVRTNFIDACLGTSGEASGYCECALNSFEERFTQAEFEAIEQEMTTSDEVSPAFDEVIEACYEEHVAGDVEESADGEWSSLLQSDFLEACTQTSGGITEHCECAIDGMQEIYTETEFMSLSLGLERGEQNPPEFDEVIETCLEQHG